MYKELSNDQKIALDCLMSWYKSKVRRSYIALGGYAGTGKTSLISLFRSKLKKSWPIAFVCYTGKASRVLKNKLVEAKSCYSNDFIGTIHSLIYKVVTNSKGEIIGWERRPSINYDLIIIDEASMVDEVIWQDLLSYNKPIIAVGDHGQLPPVRGQFNLMEKPDLKLEEIHRQAKDNPIIKLSIVARKAGYIPFGNFGQNVVKLQKGSDITQERIKDLLSQYNDNTLVLCGYNQTRIKMNILIRSYLGYRGLDPLVGDRVICLKNNRENNIFNGMLGIIQSIGIKDKVYFETDIRMDDEDNVYSGLIYRKQFNQPQTLPKADKKAKVGEGDFFDFGYALTVHKAQGSQALKVILIEERFPRITDEEWRGWLYTGVTRAERELCIVGN